MGAGLAHIQYGDHYPLVNPSDDIKYLIVDMTVSYTNSSWEYYLPLKIKQFNRNTGKLVITNSSNTTVFNATADTPTTWGGKYKVFKWITSNCVVKMVIDNTVSTVSNILPQNAVIDLRAVWCAPKHVLTINGYKGDFIFEAGHNIDLFGEYDIINIDAVAGAGSGKIEQTCTQSDVTGVKSINGVKPDENGTIFLKCENGPQITSKCYTLIITNTNEPCCRCEDMCSFSNYLKEIIREITITKAKAEWLRDAYKKQLAYWKSLPVCSTAEAIYLQLDPGPCPYATLTIRVTNLNKLPAKITVTGSFSKSMLLVSETTIETETVESSDMLVWVNEDPMTGLRSYPRPAPITKHFNEGVEPESTFTWDCVPPNSSASHTGKYILADVPEKADIPLKYTITAITAEYNDGTTASMGSPYLSGRTEVETELDCDSEPQDTITNEDAIEDVNRRIWERKRELYPCPGREDLHFDHYMRTEEEEE